MALVADQMNAGPPAPGQPGQPGQSGQMSAPSGPPQGGEEQATPEEQEAYEKAMVAVGRMLYDKGAVKDIVDAIKAAPDPGTALGEQALQVVMAVDSKSGGQIPESMLAPIAMDTLGEVAEAVEAGGIDVNGQLLTKALTVMITGYLRDQGVGEQDIQRALQDLDVQSMAAEIDKGLGAEAGPAEEQEPGEEQPGQPEEDQPGMVASEMEDE